MVTGEWLDNNSLYAGVLCSSSNPHPSTGTNANANTKADTNTSTYTYTIPDTGSSANEVWYC